MPELDLKTVREYDGRFHIGVYGANGQRLFANILPDTGEGVFIRDSNGIIYTDCVAGIASNILGYGDRGFNSAIINLLINRGIVHESNFYPNDVQSLYAKELCEVLSAFMTRPKVFLCNSGGEAVEGAIKDAFLNKKPEGDDYDPAKDDRYIVSMNNSFHGRNGFALAVTGQEKYRKDFQALLGMKVRFVDFNDEKGLENITYKTYAVIIEAIQGEGGIIEAHLEYMQKLREACNKYGVLLIVDEVQTGFARTGKMFAIQHYGIEPDIICMAKAIANGVPFGAFAVNERADLLVKGQHASTYGGGYLACTAAREVLRQIKERDLPANATRMGDLFRDWSGQIQSPAIVGTRGKGLMLGVEFDTPEHRDKIISGCIDDKVLFAPSSTKTLRIVPPLIIKPDEFNNALYVLGNNIKKLQ